MSWDSSDSRPEVKGLPITLYQSPTLIFLISMLMFSRPGFAATCKPHMFFVHGQTERWFSPPNLETTFYNIKVPFEAAGIRSEFHTHWQAEDDLEHVGSKCLGGVAIGAGVATGTCITTSLFFPPLAAACPFIIPGAIGAGASCAMYMLAMMGDLGESMVTQLERGADPIILVGHSWGGDTAYEFARDHLPRAIKESKHKPKVILVTLDAVGEKGEYRRRSLGKGARWINVHNGKEAQSGCGGNIVNLADFLGSNPYGIQRNADVDIRIDERVRSSLIPGQYISNVTHCDTDIMYYVVQEYIADEIKDVCGSQFSVPAANLKDGVCNGKWCRRLDFSMGVSY